MQPARPATRKIDTRRSFGNIRICEERSTAQLTIRSHALRAGKIPLQSQRIYSRAIRCIGFLKHHEYWHSVNGILEAPAKKHRAVFIRENPAITHSDIPQRGIRCPAICAVTAAGPCLHLASAFLRTILSADICRSEKKEQGENTKTFSQRKVSCLRDIRTSSSKEPYRMRGELTTRTCLKKRNRFADVVKFKEGGGPGLPASFSFPLRGKSVA